MLELPSPNDQLHDVGVLVERSVNVTVNGAVPDVGEPVKEAIGVGTVVGVVVGTDVGIVVGTVVGIGIEEYVNWSAIDVADVPADVVTVMSTVPAACAGLVAVTVICVSLFTVYEVADVLPKFTLFDQGFPSIKRIRFVPVIVTEVPPAVVPDVGQMLVMVGAAKGGANFWIRLLPVSVM